jgi:hypothetical protein
VILSCLVLQSPFAPVNVTRDTPSWEHPARKTAWSVDLRSILDGVCRQSGQPGGVTQVAQASDRFGNKCLICITSE